MDFYFILQFRKMRTQKINVLLFVFITIELYPTVMTSEKDPLRIVRCHIELAWMKTRLE